MARGGKMKPDRETVPALVARLKTVVDAPALTLSVEGGGIPEKQVLRVLAAVVVDRRDIEAVIVLLQANELVPR